MNKKLMSIMLAFLISISTIANLSFVAIAQSGVWDGAFSTQWYTSVVSNEYHISTAKELAGMAYLVNTRQTEFLNKTIYLDSDIDLAGHEWIPIDWGGWTDKAREYPGFRGTLDGQGHTISNMTITTIKAASNAGTEPVGADEYYSEIGLFGRMDGVVRNLKMDKANITLPQEEARKVLKAGFIAGTICFDSPKSDGMSPGIFDCHVANSKIDGNGIAVANTFAGFIYHNPVISGCSQNGNTIQISDNISWINTYDLQTYSSYDSVTNFVIKTPYELAAIVALAASGRTFSEKTVTLAKDIDMSMYEWTPINTFNGTFNGNNHAIVNIHRVYNTETMSFIMQTTAGCIINDLTVDVDFKTVKKSVSSSGSSVGGIIGIIEPGITEITNCSVYGTVGSIQNEKEAFCCSDYAGGFVGIIKHPYDSNQSTSVTIMNCRNFAQVSGCEAGGLIGIADNHANGNLNVTVKGCINAGSVFSGANGSAGGLVGTCAESTLTVKSCGVLQNTKSGSILEIKGTYAGGFVGKTYDGYVKNAFSTITITDSFCTAEVLAQPLGYASGIINIPVKSLFSTAGIPYVSVKSSYFGGILSCSNIDNAVEHTFLCFYTNYEKDKYKVDVSNVYLISHFYYWENGVEIHARDYANIDATNGKKEGKVTWFKVYFNEDNSGTGSFKCRGENAIVYTSLDFVEKMNSFRTDSSISWTSINNAGNAYQYGMPFLGSPVDMHTASLVQIAYADISISGTPNSDLNNNSYQSFTDQYSKADGTAENPWVTAYVNTGITFRIESKNAGADEYIEYSKQLFPEDDVITLHIVNDKKTGYVGEDYTYVTTGSEESLNGETICRIPLKNFKDSNGVSFVPGSAGARSLYFTVRFGTLNRSIGSIGECYLLYNSLYTTAVKHVILKSNDIILSAIDPPNGIITIDNENFFISYVKNINGINTEINDYLGSSGAGLPICVTPDKGYKIKSVSVTDKKTPYSTTPISVTNSETLRFVWNKSGEYTMNAELEKLKYSVLFDGANTTLCDENGDSVNLSSASVEYGADFKFKTSAEVGYKLLSVKANGAELSADANGVYTASNNTGLLKISASAKGKENQSNLSFASYSTDLTYGDASFSMAVSGGSGIGAISYTSSNPAVATVNSDGNIEIIAAGTFTVTAVKAADDDYKEASVTSSAITVSPKDLTVSVEDVTVAKGDSFPSLTVKVEGFVNGENEELTGFQKPTAAVNGTINTYDSSLNSFMVTYSGGNATNNYSFDLSKTTVGLLIQVFPADYDAVNAAIASIPDDLSVYTTETANAVTAARDAVDRNKDITEQEIVDGYAVAINIAVSSLEKKQGSPQTGDNSNMALWIALLFISGSAVTVLGISQKRKKAKE